VRPRNVRFAPESGHRNLPSTQQLRQRRDIGGDALGLVFGEQLGRELPAGLLLVHEGGTDGAVTEVTRSWIWIELAYGRKLHWECQLLGALP
jgi:hypothetical protein